MDSKKDYSKLAKRERSFKHRMLPKLETMRLFREVRALFEPVERSEYSASSHDGKWTFATIEELESQCSTGRFVMYLKKKSDNYEALYLYVDTEDDGSPDVSFSIDGASFELIRAVEETVSTLVASSAVHLDLQKDRLAQKVVKRKVQYTSKRFRRSAVIELIERIKLELSGTIEASFECGPSDNRWEFGSESQFRDHYVEGAVSFRISDLKIGSLSAWFDQSDDLFGRPQITLSLKSTLSDQVHTLEEYFRKLVAEKADSLALPAQRVFIGHGRSADWKKLRDYLQDHHKVDVQAYETGSRVGFTIKEVLDELLDSSSLAILVHTPDDQKELRSLARPNVIHETGLFQAKLGWTRVAVLLKSGTEEFSNIAGLQQIRYKSISNAYGDVLAWIQRENAKRLPPGA